jgi:hypothetical protein
MRPLVKLLNPVMIKLAGRRHAEYRADRPQFVDGPEAGAAVRQAFGPAERAMFRVLGIRQYLLLRRAAS